MLMDVVIASARMQQLRLGSAVACSRPAETWPIPQTRSDCLLAVQIRLKLQDRQMLRKIVRKRSAGIRRRPQRRTHMVSLRMLHSPLLLSPAHGKCHMCQVKREALHSSLRNSGQTLTVLTVGPFGTDGSGKCDVMLTAIDNCANCTCYHFSLKKS
jgi:hypothetical protein